MKKNNFNNYNPYTILNSRNRIISNFDELFNKVIESSFPEIINDFGVNNLSKSSYPKVDVLDTDSTVSIIAEIPGYSKEDVKIEYEKGSLTISGASRNEKEDGSKTYIYRELKRSSFNRSFGIDDTILDAKNISAKFENGILEISIPKIKKEEETSSKITINII